ncbi:hypothetical protein [Streptomyces longwoodensis]|uniref:hypothetical protein n=1 Tax=Streptomyces longwoodensis TaxID=68231 RepID=UPI0036FB8878
MKELRRKAEQAHRAVIEEEDRQRDAYNDALSHLHELVTARLTGGRWVVSERSRKHTAIIGARPDWVSGETLVVQFHHAEADTPDLYEDLCGVSVEVIEVATGHAIRFNHAPHADVLMAVVDAVVARTPGAPKGRNPGA